jgi:hypothetical protein
MRVFNRLDRAPSWSSPRIEDEEDDGEDEGKKTKW